MPPTRPWCTCSRAHTGIQHIALHSEMCHLHDACACARACVCMMHTPLPPPSSPCAHPRLPQPRHIAWRVKQAHLRPDDGPGWSSWRHRAKPLLNLLAKVWLCDCVHLLRVLVDSWFRAGGKSPSRKGNGPYRPRTTSQRVRAAALLLSTAPGAGPFWCARQRSQATRFVSSSEAAHAGTE